MGPAGDCERINASLLQPLLSYTTGTYTSFTINSESSYDWQARESAVPVHLMVPQLLRLGGQPISRQFGPRYWFESSENAPQGWGVRAAFTLLFPR